MKARDIKAGDELREPRVGGSRPDGQVVYRVVKVLPRVDELRDVQVLVRYEVDGGTDVRAFGPGQEVPLFRPEPEPEPVVLPEAESEPVVLLDGDGDLWRRGAFRRFHMLTRASTVNPGATREQVEDLCGPVRQLVPQPEPLEPRRADWQDGDVATFIDDKRGKQVAIRRDYGWKDGQWQVAAHGFWRVTDEFITENGTRMEEVGSASAFTRLLSLELRELRELVLDSSDELRRAEVSHYTHPVVRSVLGELLGRLS